MIPIHTLNILCVDLESRVQWGFSCYQYLNCNVSFWRKVPPSENNQLRFKIVSLLKSAPCCFGKLWEFSLVLSSICNLTFLFSQGRPYPNKSCMDLFSWNLTFNVLSVDLSIFSGNQFIFFNLILALLSMQSN